MRGGTHTIPESGEGERAIDVLDCGQLASHPDDRRREAQRRHRRDMGGRATAAGTLSAVECRLSMVVNVGQDEQGRG